MIEFIETAIKTLEITVATDFILLLEGIESGQMAGGGAVLVGLYLFLKEVVKIAIYVILIGVGLYMFGEV